MNFKSHRDLSDLSSRRIPDVRWPDPFDKDLQLRMSRYTLEIFQIILAKSKDYEKLTNEECDQLANLARRVLEFYSPSPVNRICRCDLIASALIKERLIDDKQVVLESQVTEKVREWLKQATEASMKIMLEISEKKGSEKDKKTYKDFKGETDWIFVDGMVCWGSIHTLSGEFHPRVSDLHRTNRDSS